VLLGSHIISDGSLSRTAGVTIGGTQEPISHLNLDQAYKSLKLIDPQKMKDRLNEVSMNHWFTCIDKALEKSQLKRKDIDYLAILHMKRSGHEEMLNILKLTPYQSIYSRGLWSYWSN
jgi:3-oxoacyl-[acyl-carrier-protein] synthase III